MRIVVIMDENFKILKAEYDDLDDILRLQKLAFLSEAALYNNYKIEPLTQTMDSIRADYENHLFLKVECENRIVGSVKIRIQGSACWVGRLIVDPQFQGKGVGRRLMTEIEKISSSITEYYFFTGSKSVKNIRLYESVGYKQIEEFCDDKNPDLILIKMIKTVR